MRGLEYDQLRAKLESIDMRMGMQQLSLTLARLIRGELAARVGVWRASMQAVPTATGGEQSAAAELLAQQVDELRAEVFELCAVGGRHIEWNE